MDFKNDSVITIDVTVNTTVEKAWETWTKPAHITNWNFASDDWCCPTASNEVKEGGDFSWRMEAKDGSFGFDFNGTYSKVVPNKLLEYDLGDGRPVTVKFQQQGSKTIVTETFQGEDTNTLEQQRNGWQCILNNFKKYIENNNSSG